MGLIRILFMEESENMLKSNILKFIGVFVISITVGAFIFAFAQNGAESPTASITQRPETSQRPETTLKPETSLGPKATLGPETTIKPETAPEPEITLKPETTLKPEIVLKPETTPNSPTSQKTQAIPEKTPAATLRPTQQSTQTIIITKTIVVKAGTTYDGKGVRIVAKGMGSGDMEEDQKPIFKLEKGANLKNVRIGAPGCDGVHCYGDNIVENVVWEDVGEDALTVKKEGSVTVKGGSAYNADGNIFQLNQPCTFTISDFTGDVFAKAIRQDGDTSFKCTIYLENCTFSNADECIARTDSKKTQLYYKNLNITNADELWIFPSESQIHTY